MENDLEEDQTTFEFGETAPQTGKETEQVTENNEESETGDESDPPDDADDENVDPEDFQVALDRLKELARELESGELPLEEAMERYREGLGLIDFCEDRLEEAELLVEEIDDSGDQPEVRDKPSEEP